MIRRRRPLATELRRIGPSLKSLFLVVVASIEESKDLSILSVNQLMGSLQSHEARIKRSPTKIEEKALQAQDTVGLGI